MWNYQMSHLPDKLGLLTITVRSHLTSLPTSKLAFGLIYVLWTSHLLLLADLQHVIGLL